MFKKELIKYQPIRTIVKDVQTAKEEISQTIDLLLTAKNV